jgi:hypothetical protein
MPLAVDLAIVMRPARYLRDLRMHRHYRLMIEARRPVYYRRTSEDLSRIRLHVPVAVNAIFIIVRLAIPSCRGRIIPILPITMF